MAIYGFDGQFGSFKTCSAVFLAYASQGPKTAIISNVKISDRFIKNYFYFSDDEFLGVLRTINAINNDERELYSRLLPSASGDIDENSIRLYNRDAFTRFIVIFDELGGLASSTDYRDHDTRINQYILQCRKMKADLFLISQKITRMLKALRENIDWVLYAVPLFDFWIFREFIIIRKKKIDDDGNTQVQSFIGKDQNGDYIKKEKPLDFYLRWYYAPPIWRMYDDWHKNIKDDKKHEIIPRIYEKFKFREADLNLESQVTFLDFLKYIFFSIKSIFQKKKMEDSPKEPQE